MIDDTIDWKIHICSENNFPTAAGLASSAAGYACFGRFLTSVEMEMEIFYLTTHSTHLYLRLYGVGHMVKDHFDSERGNPLPPHGLHFPINSKGSFICTIPQTG